MIILGLNAYHADASACVVLNGDLIAAAEEERFNRIKHWAGFPIEAIRYCLKESGIGIKDVDYIAINRRPGANFFRKAAHVLSKRYSVRALLDRLANVKKVGTIHSRMCSGFGIEYSELKAKIYQVEHHRAHLAGSFFVAPFESAAVVSVDGFGDFASTMWGEGKGRHIKVHGKVNFPHSLGLFYLAVTQYLGFRHYGDEYKVMGLAPYGEPEYLDAMRRIVNLKNNGKFKLNLAYFMHHSKGVSMVWDNGAPTIGNIYSQKLEQLLGFARKENGPFEQRHFNIAASLQEMYEEVFFHIINFVFTQTENPVLCLSGGCAMNSVANGKIFERTGYQDLFVQPAAGDSGGAVGAAFYLWNETLGKPRTYTMKNAYLGPEFSDDQIASLIGVRLLEPTNVDCTVTEIKDEVELCNYTAAHIAGGKVVGWFQGRMEFGPRALGNRSIVCDPRRTDMKHILNVRVKRRESFRPFAPTVLREAVADWFETDYEVPFMLQVYQVKADKRKLIPAVTHVNGSGRLQTVTASQNPRLHRLIKSFEEQTGIPMVLNTSFNENEPIVCRPEEALDCFLRTKMDLIVMGNWVIERKE